MTDAFPHRRATPPDRSGPIDRGESGRSLDLVAPSSRALPVEYVPEAGSGDASGAQPISPLMLFTVLRRHKALIAGVMLAVSVPAIVLIDRMAPYYDASALLLVDTHKASFRDLQATVDQPDADAVSINTQVGILKDRGLATQVVDRLDLTRSPEFVDAVEAEPLTKRIEDRVEGWFGRKPSHVPPTPYQLRQSVTDLLMGRVQVLNDGRSTIITVTARTGNPELSAKIANAYVAAYLDFKRDLKISAIQRANGLLDAQIAPVRARLRKAEQAVEEYREHNGLMAARLSADGAPGGTDTVADQQLVQMNSQLVTAQADLAMRRARYDAIHGGGSSSAPDVVASPMVQQLRGEEAQLAGRVASLSQTLADGNPTLQAAQAALAQVRRQIGAASSDVVGSAAKELQSAEARVASLQQSIDALQKQVTAENQADVTLGQLQSEANAARTVYQDFLGRLEQTSSQAALQESEADQITQAEPPTGPSGPKRMRFDLAAVLGAFILACLAALLRDRMTQGLRSVHQLESATGLFGLGLIPAFKGRLPQQYETPTGTVYTETVENTRNVLSFGHDRFRADVVVVTSAEPAEGKTTFALSLAASAGRDGQRVLVVDCDLRSPSALRVAGKSAPVDPAEQAGPRTTYDALPGVDICTFPRSPGSRRGMVRMEEFRALIAHNRSLYNMIIVDTPPVLAYPDAAVLARFADGVVMAVRWHRTRAASVVAALRQLRSYDVRVLGGVLTQARLGELSLAEGNPIKFYHYYDNKASVS